MMREDGNCQRRRYRERLENSSSHDALLPIFRLKVEATCCYLSSGLPSGPSVKVLPEASIGLRLFSAQA